MSLLTLTASLYVKSDVWFCCGSADPQQRGTKTKMATIRRGIVDVASIGVFAVDAEYTTGSMIVKWMQPEWWCVFL